MSDANQEIHVIAEAQAKPGQDAALRDVLQACVTPTRAEQGNRGYALHEDLDTPGRFFLYETWTSRDALKQHLQTPHFKTLDQNSKPLLAKPLSIAVVRASLRANDDETNTCREFTLGGIGQTSSGYAPNQRQQDSCSSRR